MFGNVATGNTRAFELFADHPLDMDTIRSIVAKFTLVSFNGNNFDMPLLSLALSGADNQTIKDASDAIILNNLRGFALERKFKFKTMTKVDHIDLIEVAPGMVSLKIYGGRLHCKKMQDLPIDPSASISAADRELLKTYCVNDLQVTQALYLKLAPQIALRTQMGKAYGLELRSKSDAQIAETVIRTQVKAITGVMPERPIIDGGTLYQYSAPDYIRFSSAVLKTALKTVQAAQFRVIDSGKVIEPDEIKNAKVTIGASVYRMGIGGLHSSEVSTSHVADKNTLLTDRDVASYYPSIILGSSLAPVHMGEPFLRVYRDIVEQRLAAKHAGDKVKADALKITINGSFGKFGSKWSALYSPDLLIQTTLTGQLALLMLIEALEAAGIAVVSANTDGVVIKCPVSKQDAMDDIVFEWETCTGFNTEATHYRALYSRDVNNYLAFKLDGGFKAKGAYASAGLSKNPANEICTDAVVAFLKDGTAIDDTLHACWDISRFVTIRSVKGGAIDQQGHYLGKAVRWYYSTTAQGPIRYRLNHYTVARSDGAQALMELPDKFPSDVDFDWYIAEAQTILKDIGIRT
jgi:hypothetical protein